MPPQQFETIFPEFFTKAFEEPGADLDKNKRVDLGGVHLCERPRPRLVHAPGSFATERLLDDTGDGVGGEADNGRDGASRN